MEKAKLTSKGQITIPKGIRNKLNVNEESSIIFEELKDNGCLIYKEGSEPPKFNSENSNQLTNDKTLLLFEKMMNYLDKNDSDVHSNSSILHHRESDIDFVNGKWIFSSGFIKLIQEFSGPAMIIELFENKAVPVLINDKLYSIFGIAPHNHSYTSFEDVVSEESISAFYNVLNRVIQNEEEVEITLRLKAIGNSVIPVEVHSYFRKLTEKNSRNLIFVRFSESTKISAINNNTIKDNSLIFKDIFNKVPGGILYCSLKEGRVSNVFINNYFLNTLGYGQDQVLANVESDYTYYLHPSDRDSFRNACRDSLATSKINQLEIRILNSKNEAIWFLVTIKVYKADDYYNALVTFADINSFKVRESRLLFSSTYDALSGILNRLAALKEINSLLAKPHKKNSYLVILMDINKFKLINDTYGHQMGDVVITKAAKILLNNALPKSVVGRLGGDEFLIFGQAVSSEKTLREAMYRINSQLSDVSKELELSNNLSMSFGIYYVQSGDNSFYQFFEKVDKAMYIAKQKPDCVYFYNHREIL